MTRRCVICEAPAEASIPQGRVCRAHAIEFYAGLVQYGKLVEDPVGEWDYVPIARFWPPEPFDALRALSRRAVPVMQRPPRRAYVKRNPWLAQG